MELLPGDLPSLAELRELYDSVGWSVYTADPEALGRAVRNSTFAVSARIGGNLVGLARVLSDDVSILYVQDVLVHPSHQRQGIGSSLLGACLDRFAHVRQRVLLTDDEPHQHRLYRRFGFHDLARVSNVGLSAFVDIADANLRSED